MDYQATASEIFPDVNVCMRFLLKDLPVADQPDEITK
jgi:hypothetical protein